MDKTFPQGANDIYNLNQKPIRFSYERYDTGKEIVVRLILCDDVKKIGDVVNYKREGNKNTLTVKYLDGIMDGIKTEISFIDKED